VIKKKAAEYMRKGKVIHIPHLIENSDYSIVAEYQSKLRGLYQFYALATNVSDLHDLKWIMEQSLLKTLANKHKCSTYVIGQKYAVKGNDEIPRHIKVTVDRDEKKPLAAIFGGFPLTRKQVWKIDDQPPPPINHLGTRTELLQRLLADKCEVCSSTEMVEVHHIRRMKDVQGNKNERTDWKKYMASRRRKTLVVCKTCHDLIHAGKPLPTLANH